MTPKRIHLLLGLFFLAILFPVKSLAVVESDPKHKAFENIYQQIDEAMKHGDADTIIGFETADFTRKDYSGKILNRQEADAGLRKAMKDTKSISICKAEVKSITSEKEQDIVLVSVHLECILIAPNGTEHKMVDIEEDREVWVKVDGKFKVKFSEIVGGSVTIDGQKVAG